MNMDLVKAKLYEEAVQKALDYLIDEKEYSERYDSTYSLTIDDMIERLSSIQKQVEFEMDKIKDAMHCIGLNNQKPYRRNGKLYYKPYRNMFYAWSDKETFMDLRYDGLAEFKKDESGFPQNKYTFCLNRAGLDWLGKTLGITIYDCE